MKDRLAALVDRLGAPRVLVLGDLILDRYLWGAVSRVSPEAPVPVLNVLQRPGAEGIALTGHHELMIPLLHAAVVARLPDGATR